MFYVMGAKITVAKIEHVMTNNTIVPFEIFKIGENLTHKMTSMSASVNYKEQKLTASVQMM